MQPQEATFLLSFLIPEVEQENRLTRRILAAIPEDQREYRPHADGRSALELAWHIANSEIWCLAGIIHGQFSTEPERMPSHIKKVGDVCGWWEKNVPGMIAEVRQLPVEQLTECVTAFDSASRPAVAHLLSMTSHTAHHRGQLSAYLRAMGAKVPCIYGGSADEPFYAAAQ